MLPVLDRDVQRCRRVSRSATIASTRQYRYWSTTLRRSPCSSSSGSSRSIRRATHPAPRATGRRRAGGSARPARAPRAWSSGQATRVRHTPAAGISGARKVIYDFGMPKTPGSTRGRGRRPFAAMVLLALCAAPLASCASSSSNASTGEPVVLTTFTVLADIARNVAGEHLRWSRSPRSGAEIHGYEPTPGDIRKASDADLILDNGLNLELWFDQFVESSTCRTWSSATASRRWTSPRTRTPGKPNPHAWMSPENVQIYVDNMVDAFAELDPEHAAEFAANGEAYKAELQQVQDELVEGAWRRCRRTSARWSAARARSRISRATRGSPRSTSGRSTPSSRRRRSRSPTPSSSSKANARPRGVLRVDRVRQADAAGRRCHRRRVRRHAVRRLAVRGRRPGPDVPGPDPVRRRHDHRRR